MAARTFFFYGTLLDADVRRLVMGAGAPAALEPATLIGWRRVAHPRETYPMIVPAADAAVEGAIARDLAPDTVARLVTYEGPEYRTHAVEVRLAGGGTLAAEVFVPIDPFVGAGEPWELAAWQRRHKQRYLARMRTDGPVAPTGLK
jgi:hypothetical protein